MKIQLISILISFISQSTCFLEPKFQSFDNPRRILHQPLFPENTSPLSPPPPPPSSTPVLPFFPKIPSGVSPNQPQEQPPPLSPAENTTTAQKEKSKLGSKKRFAVAISVGIVISGILLLGLGFFYLYKYKRKDLDESQKPNRRRRNSNSIPQDPILPSSTFLHIGALVEPSAAERLNLESSSNKRLNSVKFSDYYRPSPELQPLPPLTKPPVPVPSRTNSSPHLSYSEDEGSHESTFYTPNGSSLSNDNEEGSNSNTPLRNINNTCFVPHSKRSSPKSRIQNGKPAIVFPPIRPKFSAPPPPPDFARLQLITKQVHEMSKAPIPPPPPPPPPPLPLPQQIPARRVVSRPNPEFSISNLQEACKVEEMASVGKRDMVNSSLETNYGDEVDDSRPKLKPLHWDKVRATSDRATVWDKLKSSSFQLDEDVMESLFGCESSVSVPKEVKRKSVLPSHVEPQTSVLDPKKSHNIAILLRALNVTRDEVSKALLDGNLEGLGPELLETLVKMAPTKEEEIKLRDYNGDTSRLGSAERFLKAILDIPLAFKRVDAMLYRANFDTEVNYLTASFLMQEEASKELKNSKLFLKLLEAVLRTGNRMNVGTNRGDAKSFKLDTLLKLADVKGTDGKTTLLHFVVQEIIRSEESGLESTSEDHTSISSSRGKDENFRKQGLHVLAGLSRELVNVKKAATMDSTVLTSYVSKLELGLEKVRLVLQYEKPGMEGKFFESMNKFIQEAEKSIAMIKSLEQKALYSVKEVTHYFHGDATKEEAHPFRIFVIVRDFLSILDNVCKDVRKSQDRSMVVGTSTSFRAHVLPTSLPSSSLYNVRKEGSSSDSFSSN